MKRTLLILFCSLSVCVLQTHAQRPYTRVTSIDSCKYVIGIESTSGFREGDTVLIHQPTGATLNDDGSVSSLNGAGEFAIARIDRVIRTSLYLQPTLLKHLNVESGVQLCRVIGGSRVDIDSSPLSPSSLRSLPFASGLGGVVAIVADTIVLSATLDASGCGYGGGSRSVSSSDTCFTNGNAFAFDGTSGEKGRSFATTELWRCAGRQRNACGGGGGNARNAGGGGGAGGGSGGGGGNQTSEYMPLTIGGEGGIAICDSTRLRLLFGGGGGGGHQNDFNGSDGAAGGGCIYLKAKVLIGGPNALLKVDGASAGIAFEDGAGGGGAGGMVVLDVDTLVGSVSVSARGGNGGSVISTASCHGPGGGAGGGTLIVSPTVNIASISFNVSGGDAGTTCGCSAACASDTNYGAQPGSDGVLYIRSLEESTPEPCAEPDVVIGVDDVSAPPGVDVDVPLVIDVRKTLDADVNVAVRVRTRASVLLPNGPYWWAGRRAMVRYVTLTIDAGGPRVYSVPLSYQTALGDSSVVSIAIDSITNTPKRFRIEQGRNGTFTLSGVCNAGGVERLFDPFATLQQVHVYDVTGRSIDTKSLGIEERVYWLLHSRPHR